MADRALRTTEGRLGRLLGLFLSEESGQFPERDRSPDPPGGGEGRPDSGLRDFTGDAVAISERAVAEDGTVQVKIIAPGRGSTGYYPRSTLERDGPRVLRAGTKMYWDHPTPTDERERPERSLRDLAGELVSDAAYREDARSGPGLYARAKVFGAFKDAVEEMAPHIGVSIRGLGKQGDINENGQHITDAVTQLVAMHSVDFVTTPGAGGKVTQIFEAARGGHYSRTAESGREGDMKTIREQAHDYQPLSGEDLTAHMTSDHGGAGDAAAHRKAHGMAAESARLSESETRELRELRAKVSRFEEADLLREASTLATRAVARFREIPEFVRERIVREAVAAVPVKDSKIDIEAFDRVLREKLRAEVAYVARLTGAGEIRGAGGAAQPFGHEKTEAEVVKEAKAFEESQLRMFQTLGMSEKAAKIAAAGRGN